MKLRQFDHNDGKQLSGYVRPELLPVHPCCHLAFGVIKNSANMARITSRFYIILVLIFLPVFVIIYLGDNGDNHGDVIQMSSTDSSEDFNDADFDANDVTSDDFDDGEADSNFDSEMIDLDLDDVDQIFDIDDEAELFEDVDVEGVEDDLMTTQASVAEGEGEEVAGKHNRRNVLLIMADDMRPQMEAYKGEDFPAPYMNIKMHTPNIDRLAGESLFLKRAFVQYSLCGPSRTSMLTSRRPDTTRIYGNNNYWRVTGGNFTTLPQYFKESGYVTKGYGKVFHKGRSSKNNDAISWSEKYYMPPYTDSHYIEKAKSGAGWTAVTLKERQRVPLSDEYSVKEIGKDLDDIADDVKSGKKNFFFAIGFKKPHLSLVCPEEFFHLYPLEEDDQYLPDRQWQTPAVKSTVGMGDDEGSKAAHLRVIPEDAVRHLRRAYFACISFVDSMIGKVVKKLDKVGLAENTVVVFVADHGYHLGENNHWGKVTNYERATHVPMMIRIPGRTDGGVTTRSLVEGVDLYPTIVEAAGLGKVPSCPNQSSKIQVCTDGKSMLSLIENPEKKHRKVVYSQIASGGQFMSYTIRTDRYRYIDWAEVKKKQRSDGLWDLRMDWELTGDPWWTALYDRKVDPEERFNMTGDPRYRHVETKLRDRLHQFVDRLYDHPKYFVKGH
ncbi:hypothetical protein LSH36_13g25067 [Paralvinella palmiformis]|uniref:Sulfatase N-terminal domain-containing protein n=1 Tax=Paralvinella palmiformis TaxID=53620 RepID=A0AAD9NGA7_9ANNE|nr:hypothetical protein LSH36_13g25067 [Paralvinella palmiformis]